MEPQNENQVSIKELVKTDDEGSYKKLISTKKDLSENDLRSALLFAIENGSQKWVQLLLEHNLDLNKPSVRK